MDLRRYLATAALLVLACEDDAEPRPSVPLPIDGGLDVDAPPGPDAATSCEASIGQQDLDHDGFSIRNGDCDDCDPRRGPGAYDFPGNGVDEDCRDGDATSLVSCDEALEDDDTDPEHAVQALGLCGSRASSGSRRPGLIRARFMRLDASKSGLADDRQVWLPERFGTIAPREGARLLALSTGVARDERADDYTSECDAFESQMMGGAWTQGAEPPAGFPRDSKECGKQPVSGGQLAYDDVVLELELRAPANAAAFAFDSLFFTYEYPDFVCSPYNDFFVVLMDPAPRQADEDDNIVFDEDENPVGVNSGLLKVCERDARVARPIACEAGPALLKGTGYGARESTCAPLQPGDRNIGGASTGWLHTEMPVQPGARFRLRIVLWDSGDPLLDSTVLIDNFRFLAEPPERPGTTPIIAG